MTAPRTTAPRLRRSLRPVVGERPRVLILGSMPGEESLRRQQYYAHPQNQFWPILGVLTGASPELPYAQRLDRLQRAHVALWDVARVCRRHASSDATIRDAEANDIQGLLAAEPTIATVLCNGSTAHAMFLRLVLPRLERPVRIVGLPSTSPAHAALSRAQKTARWRRALTSATPALPTGRRPQRSGRRAPA